MESPQCPFVPNTPSTPPPDPFSPPPERSPPSPCPSGFSTPPSGCPMGYNPNSRRTYTSYLRTHELLSLQDGDPNIDSERTICNNERHFIIVHQVFELWFKLILTELREARDILIQDFVPERSIPKAGEHLSRTSEIFRLMANQWKVMQTLVPQDFLNFRDLLGTSSGFQSYQMRCLEIIFGLKDEERVNDNSPMNHLEHLANSPNGSAADVEAWRTVQAMQRETTLLDALDKWLARTPIRGHTPDMPEYEGTVNAFVDDYLDHVKKAQLRAAETLARDTGDLEGCKARFFEKVKEANRWLRPDGKKVNLSRAALLFIESYRSLPLLVFPRQLIDTMITLEESMVTWRNQHARTVERIIGRRIGSGGSSGVDYLDSTSKYRVFKDLWEVRTILLKTEDLPPLDESEFYSLHAEEILRSRTSSIDMGKPELDTKNKGISDLLDEIIDQ